MTEASLDALLAPRSIAIVGASTSPERIGGRPIKHLLAAGNDGAVYPVNPSHQIVQGLRCVPAIGDLPFGIDCAVIAIPASQVIEAIRQCGKRGVRSAVVFTAGFAEMGEAGVLQQRALSETARRFGMRLIGPNTVGLFNTVSRSYLTFTGAFRGDASEFQKNLRVGRRVGIVSQSGGYATFVLKLALQRGVPVTHLVATGNECDVELTEVMRWMADCPDIDVIACYVEGVRNGGGFMAALRAAATASKPVLMLKVGTTSEGAAAAASHTASLAGSDAVYDAVLRQFGAYRAQTTDELIDVMFAAAFGTIPATDNVCVLTTSGGVGIHMADRARQAGLRLPRVRDATHDLIRALAPSGSPTNPVDLTAQTNSGVDTIIRTSEIILRDGAFGALVSYSGDIAVQPRSAETYLEAIRDIRARHPQITLAPCFITSPQMVSAFAEVGCLVYDDPAKAVRAVAALAGFRQNRKALEAPAAEPGNGAAVLARGLYTEVAAKSILEWCGLRLPRERVAVSADPVLAAADAVGYPVCLKVVSSDLPHKTDVGGVALGLRDRPALAADLAKMQADIGAAAPNAVIDGYLRSEMVGGGTECIVGTNTDPVFGPVVMIGLGGVFVELLADVALRVAPVTVEEAQEMIEEIRAHRLLTGYRGEPPRDAAGLARVIAAVSVLAATNRRTIHSIEINPIMVMPDGEGVVALDAMIEGFDEQPDGAPTS